MALPTKAMLGGYILEEALAYLIRNNGYRLIEDATEDPDTLEHGGHGLLVRGRGAKHQADVLGELELPSPFTLPVRLFVEAKHRKDKCSLRDVRNAHGVISDVNEHYGTDQSRRYQQPLRRYQYRYALFATAGFGGDAQTFALAQQISLIDLSGPAFESLRLAVDAAAQDFQQLAINAGHTAVSINQLRQSLRLALGSSSANVGYARSPSALRPDIAGSWATDFAASLSSSGIGDSGLLLGFPTAPFVLVMRPDSMEALAQFVGVRVTDIPVDIRFERRDRPAGDWTITPQENPEAFTLRFGLPGVLERWLLAAPESARARAMAAKTDLLASISVFINRRLIRFTFEPVETASPTVEPHAESGSGLIPDGEEATDAAADSELRTLLGRRRPDGPLRDQESEPRPSAASLHSAAIRNVLPPKQVLRRKTKRLTGADAGWTAGAARALLSRLEQRGYHQSDVIKAAAYGDGSIDREQVLRLMHRHSSQRLNGITKPVSRVVAELKREGLLSQDARPPLKPKYVGGTAIRFTLPSDLVSALRAGRDD